MTCFLVQQTHWPAALQRTAAGGSTSQAGDPSAAAAATAGSEGADGQDLAELADDPELTAYLQVCAAR